MKRLLDLEGQQLAESQNEKERGRKREETINEGKKRRMHRPRASRLTAFEDSEYVSSSMQ